MTYAGHALLAPLLAASLVLPTINGCARGIPGAPDDDVPGAPGCEATCEAAARAAFEEADALHAPLLALESPVPAPGPVRVEELHASLRRWLDEVNERLREAYARYRRVLDHGSPRWSAAALCRLGILHEALAAKMRSVRAPESVAYELVDERWAGVPAHLLEDAFRSAGIGDRLLAVEPGGARILMDHPMTAEDRAAYEASIAEIAVPLEKRAREAFHECAAVAEAAGVVSGWSKRCAAEVAAAAPVED